jgi:hypothetical protein
MNKTFAILFTIAISVLIVNGINAYDMLIKLQNDGISNVEEFAEYVNRPMSEVPITVNILVIPEASIGVLALVMWWEAAKNNC